MLDEILKQYYEKLKESDIDRYDADDRQYVAARVLRKSVRTIDGNNNHSSLVIEVIRDFNKLEQTSIDSARIIAYMNICNENSYQRNYSETESKEIMQAYEKAAKILNNAKCAEDKHILASTIHDCTRGHPETVEAALKIYDKYLFDDTAIIDHVCGCIIRKPELIEQGFETINKSVEAYQKQEELAKKTGKKLSSNKPSYWLPIFFSCLYDKFKNEPQHYDYFDTLTRHLIKLAPHFETVHLWGHEADPFKNVTCLGQDLISPLPDDWPNDGESKYYGSQFWGTSYDIKRRILRGAIADAFTSQKPIEEIYTARLAAKEQYLRPMQKAEKKAYLEKVKKEQRAEKKARDEAKYALIRAESLKKRNASNTSPTLEFIHIGNAKPDATMFKPIKNSDFKTNEFFTSKPDGGLWASPVMKNGHSDWENWLDETQPFEERTNREIYALGSKGAQRYYLIPKADCRILKADKYEKWAPYLKEDKMYDLKMVDYEKMAEHYDAFFLPLRIGDISNNPFQMWSTQTLLVFNLDKFTIMDEREYAKYKEQYQEKTIAALRDGKDALALKKAGDTKHNRNIMLLKRKANGKT